MELIIKHLQKSFEKKEVLKDISFTFKPGKIYGLLGRNGAGKTTLFNCLNQDITIDKGIVLLQENNQQRTLEIEDIGYVLSTPTVPEFLTAREFLKFFLEINEKQITDLRSIDEYFDYINIKKEDRDRLLKDFSHGMKNKMQMLINIILKPNVLLLAEEMKNVLRHLKEDRILILSTHIMELALDLCDEIVILNHGKLQEVSKDQLDNDEFKDKILAMLREEDYA
ncbi:ABC transporter ATP-binding protein [Thomasclavelia spiroformis]|uniref:ABC transporter ATP-binding protein n=1 Tax=Thomasclavelia spiroformis TaxID=29348 RepID=UPI00294301DF|nr:ABC transporter ATP-binding protein [Thomasclavelia spiroformis]